MVMMWDEVPCISKDDAKVAMENHATEDVQKGGEDSNQVSLSKGKKANMLLNL